MSTEMSTEMRVEMSWEELKRRALLGASAVPSGGDPTEALLTELAESWLWCQGARVTEPLTEALTEAQLALLCPPAPPQETPQDIPTAVSDQSLRALLYDDSARPAELTAQRRLGLSYYLASLAHHQRVLGLTMIAPVLELLLAPLTPSSSRDQELKQSLALPPSALLSAVGARGRWLIERDPQWAPLLRGALSSPAEQPSRRMLPDELEARLQSLMEAHAELAPSELEQLLIMSHPSSLREALRDERVKALFKRCGLDLKPWLTFTQRSLPEQLDAECRS